MILGTHRSIAVACMILANGFLSVGLAQDTRVPPINKSDFFVQSGCDGANCHKSAVIATPIWSNAVHIWSDHDPHARAYRSLLTKDSLAIVQKLWGDAQTAPSQTDDPNYRGFLENNCASCHASELAPVSQRQQGVDCQSCHGSATVWDPSHYSSDWRVLGVNRYKDPSDPGRLNMESAWVAARVCGSCHIGELGRVGQVEFDDGTKAAIGQREVSHKLMAAGHPPTYFELSHFLLKYPKHWWDQDNVAAAQVSISQDDKKLSPANARSLDTWRIGKLVNAKQRLELLRNRIGKAEWPEFTEHRCSSCHHPIDVGTQKINGSDLAFAEWDAWYLEQVDLAIAITQLPLTLKLEATNSSVTEFSESKAGNSDSDSIKEWNDHRSLLQKSMLDPRTIHQDTSMQLNLEKTCTAMIDFLGVIIANEYPIVDDASIALVKNAWANRVKTEPVPTSWESAVQLKLAAQAIFFHGRSDNSYPPFPLDKWDLPIDMWKRQQAMPYESSRDFDWNEFNKQLRELINSLK